MTQSVLISGGGIVGSYLGLELAARNIPFQIIEKSHPKPSPIDHIRTLMWKHTTAVHLTQGDIVCFDNVLAGHSRFGRNPDNRMMLLALSERMEWAKDLQ